MSSKHRTLTPYVVTFGAQPSPYQLPPMHRYRVSHHGAVMVRLQRNGEQRLFSLPMAAYWALSDEETLWLDGQRLYQIYQHTLSEIEHLLRRVGTYAQERERRMTAKAFGAFANPLCRTVVMAPLLDGPDHAGFVGHEHFWCSK
ncbi:MAG: hypothetical protein H0X24_10840 [Ktedonobacterales bacterium]|nr:hypothetical protein [Ktedonobacterales bacterium]